MEKGGDELKVSEVSLQSMMTICTVAVEDFDYSNNHLSLKEMNTFLQSFLHSLPEQTVSDAQNQPQRELKLFLKMQRLMLTDDTNAQLK